MHRNSVNSHTVLRTVHSQHLGFDQFDDMRFVFIGSPSGMRMSDDVYDGIFVALPKGHKEMLAAWYAMNNSSLK